MASYFNSRALRNLGMDRATVEMLRDIYDRSGGDSSVTLSLTDLESIVFAVVDKLSQAATLRNRVADLERRLSNMEQGSRRSSTRAIESRIETLEALTL